MIKHPADRTGKCGQHHPTASTRSRPDGFPPGISHITVDFVDGQRQAVTSAVVVRLAAGPASAVRCRREAPIFLPAGGRWP